MKLFKLLRTEDESGVSGTGIVAEGVIFTDGTTVIKWLTEGASLNIYNDSDTAIKIHGHGGKTKMISHKAKPGSIKEK